VLSELKGLDEELYDELLMWTQKVILETCRRMRLPARDYLASILPGLADFPLRHVSRLTPAAWAKKL
jgi:hypothetical protein